MTGIDHLFEKFHDDLLSEKNSDGKSRQHYGWVD
jgi:hypothetical protein